jgi:hypothetical protein
MYLSTKLNQDKPLRTPLSDIALAKKELHDVLNMQYQKIVDSQLGVWGQILGMAQAAAVGVLAYEHIRRYYFKKK